MRMDEKTTNAKKNLFVSVKEFFQKDLVQYIVKRLFMFFPTLFLISILAFFVIQLPETDYVDREISKLISEGEMITQEVRSMAWTCLCTKDTSSGSPVSSGLPRILHIIDSMAPTMTGSIPLPTAEMCGTSLTTAWDLPFWSRRLS